MSTEDVLLRPALELAFGVAYFGLRAKPPLDVPPAVQPYLKFQKLPATALVPFRKALEKDEEFRMRVGAAATEEVAGRAGVLWLQRPEGWEEEFAELVAARDAELATEAEAHADKRAAKRLIATEDALRRAEAELAVRRVAQERAEAARVAAEVEAAKVRQRAEELERALAKARGRSERATERAEALESELDVLRSALAAAVSRADEAERGQMRAPAAAAENAMPAQAETPTPEAPVEAEPAAVPATVSTQAVRALVDAAEATAALAQALGRAAAALAPEGAADADAPVEPDETRRNRRTASAGASIMNGHGPRGGRRPTGAIRRPLRFPRGLTADSAEGIDWLVAEAGARVLVDGYNVAKLGWPDEPLATQRERLLDALDDLVCRRGPDIDVVFDGADVGPITPGKRRQVRVRFSRPGELADDVLRALVRHLPPEQQIVVVTNDRAVVDDVKSSGANVVRSEQLLSLARR